MKIDKKLKLLILIEIVLIILHRLLDSQKHSTDIIFLDWHFLLALGFGIFVVLYAFMIKCPICGTRQVVRGVSLSAVKFPSDRCYKCDSLLNQISSETEGR